MSMESMPQPANPTDEIRKKNEDALHPRAGRAETVAAAAAIALSSPAWAKEPVTDIGQSVKEMAAVQMERGALLQEVAPKALELGIDAATFQHVAFWNAKRSLSNKTRDEEFGGPKDESSKIDRAALDKAYPALKKLQETTGVRPNASQNIAEYIYLTTRIPKKTK